MLLNAAEPLLVLGVTKPHEMELSICGVFARLEGGYADLTPAHQ